MAQAVVAALAAVIRASQPGWAGAVTCSHLWLLQPPAPGILPGVWAVVCAVAVQVDTSGWVLPSGGRPNDESASPPRSASPMRAGSPTRAMSPTHRHLSKNVSRGPVPLGAQVGARVMAAVKEGAGGAGAGYCVPTTCQEGQCPWTYWWAM